MSVCLKTILLFAAVLSGAAAFDARCSFAEEKHVHDAAPAVRYYCPMHPQIISDKPGNCPICNMRLVPDTSASKSGGRALEGRIAVDVSDAGRQSLNIRTAAAEKRPMHQTVEAWGRVAHDPELYELQVEFLREESLYFQRDRSPTIISQGRGITAREKVALKFYDLGLSQQWIEDLIAAGVPDKRLLYHHAADGVWVYLQLRENDAVYAEKNRTAVIRVPALGEAVFEGRILYLDGKVDDETGTIRARVLLDRHPEELKPHMAVSGTIQADLGTVLAVPEGALFFTGRRSLVFVDENGTFKPREVVTGAKAGGYYEIKEGLMPGEKVAADGGFFIDSESRLRSSLESSGHAGHGSAS